MWVYVSDVYLHYMCRGKEAPEIGAESGQDIFVGFEADTFDHQHAVTEQTLNPLLLELLEEVGAVAGQSVHGHSAADQRSSSFPINRLDKLETASDLLLLILMASN